MPTVNDRLQKLSDRQIAEFVMSFVAESDEMRDEFLDTWVESMQNYLVKPVSNRARDKDFPLTTATVKHEGLTTWSILKDSESHQIVETLLANVMVNVMGEPGFVKTRRRGLEDTFKASTTSRLLEYDLELPHHFRVIYQWLKDAFIFGTGIVGLDWEFEEQLTVEREFSFVGAVEVSEEFAGVNVVRDDPTLFNVDMMDFYPSPGKSILAKMPGVVVRFRMRAEEALQKARNTPGWSVAAVKRAIRAAMTEDTNEQHDMVAFEGLDRPEKRKPHPDFIELVGFEYWGEVPWRVPQGEDRWRVLTILGGENVVPDGRSWPRRERRVPFYDFTVNPMSNRFYGLSPLEVSRYSQDFADTILMCLADATVRMAHPPWIVQRDARVNKQKLREFHPNVPVETDSIAGIQQLTFNPPLQAPFAILQQEKQSMRERTGATNVEQGLSFGTKRLTASEAAIQAGRSSVRPEMIHQLAERDALPQLGHGLLALNQQFLEDSAALRQRIGDRPPAFITDIFGDHDVRFVGSRTEHNKQTRIQALERAAQVAAQTPAAPLFPWIEFYSKYLRALDLDELESFIAEPEKSRLYSALVQLTRGGGAQAANNGVQEQPAPSGLLPAQLAGGPIGG